ncbi:uncharacterized protein N7511_010858 [Penicillium nucicola]|uniref:uncharacterized protein n=1 Tax=Penicillium nucicola TaxID=1850975 RepID=UPI0025455DDA|nr:uncharacterized protein N7511_010858 [Penicillium nucicola]KAJ5749162.1 hypothetical protein N7511_010858 [Penicillium nucicola]
MGYSEPYCHLCGVSFNIIFSSTSGKLDDDPDSTLQWEPPVVKTTDVVCCTDHEDADSDTEYNPQETQDSEPYEYDSDVSYNTSDEDVPEHEETTDTTDTETQFYTEWARRTFNPNCREPEERVGYFDASSSAYSTNIISPEAARGCRTAQFLFHKSNSWQPDEHHEAWEVHGEWALSGICDGVPSRDCDIPTVWPARGGVETLEADNTNYYPHMQPDDIAMPFHPWCFDIFCRQSKVQFKHIDTSALMKWRNTEFDRKSFLKFPRAKEVRRAQDQWWDHEPGSEYLVANPLYVPGLPELLISAVNGESSDKHFGGRQKDRSSEATRARSRPSQHRRVNLLSSMPLEIRLMIIDFLGSDDVTRLRAASRTFTNLPSSVWYRLTREEMPWLWEAWDESECTHSPQIWTRVSTAQVKSILKSRKLLSNVLSADYMKYKAAEKAAEYWLPMPCDMPNQVDLPRLGTDWRVVFTQIKQNWRRLKGLQNRRRIWTDVEEIIRRIRNLEMASDEP